MSLDRDRLPDPVSYYQSRGIQVPERGTWFTARCEFHGGSDSMRIKRQTGAYVCMALCGAKGGDVLAYEMANTGAGFVEAARALGAWNAGRVDGRPQAMRNKPLPFLARDGLEVLADEAALVAVAACSLSRGASLTRDDLARVLKAAGRIRAIAEISA